MSECLLLCWCLSAGRGWIGILQTDHEFSKFSIVPSVSPFVDIPSDISGSWYHGQVNVNLKEGTFEPSSPLWHSAELENFMISHNLVNKPILCLYSNGGPDQRLTYPSVKVALICLYIFLDLDYLIAARTVPQHSWRNPVGRVMSTLNLGLQCVGLERHAGDERFEGEVKDCNTMKDLRKAAKKHPQLHEEALDSVVPVKALLTGVFQRLKLKDKSIQVSPAATEEQLTSIWESILCIDSSCEPNCFRRKSDLKQAPKVKEFLSHCTRERHYFFEIKKVWWGTVQHLQTSATLKGSVWADQAISRPSTWRRESSCRFQQSLWFSDKWRTQTINEKMVPEAAHPPIPWKASACKKMQTL